MSTLPRLLAAVAMLAALASCGGRDYDPPRNLDNACLLVDERPAYLRAMREAEREWNVPVAVQMAIIHAESRFRGNARTPHQYALGVIPIGRQSSAYGYSQALDGTWEEYQQITRNHRGERDDIRDATDFIGWYASTALAQNNIQPWDARNLYLAYHEGNAGYRRGSYRNQTWLLNVAQRVGDRAIMYDAQLRSCGRV